VPQSQDIGYNEPEKGFGRLYGKAYLDGQNILDGDCVVGGLLPIGRQQHRTNGLYVCNSLVTSQGNPSELNPCTSISLIHGRFLRDAYIGDGPLKLFPTANLSVSVSCMCWLPLLLPELTSRPCLGHPAQPHLPSKVNQHDVVLGVVSWLKELTPQAVLLTILATTKSGRWDPVRLSWTGYSRPTERSRVSFSAC